MKRCWFAGVKCDMKAEGVNIDCHRGRRMLGTRYSGAELAKVWGIGLDRGCIVVLLRVFFLENCYFTVLWRDFSAGTGYLGRMMGTV